MAESPGVAADAPDLIEAERKVRTYLAVHGDDNMERVLVEYDQARAELARVRAAVTALAGELDGLGFNGFRDGAQVAARLRETLTQP